MAEGERCFWHLVSEVSGASQCSAVHKNVLTAKKAAVLSGVSSEVKRPYAGRLEGWVRL